MGKAKSKARCKYTLLAGGVCYVVEWDVSYGTWVLAWRCTLGLRLAGGRFLCVYTFWTELMLSSVKA